MEGGRGISEVFSEISRALTVSRSAQAAPPPPPDRTASRLVGGSGEDLGPPGQTGGTEMGERASTPPPLARADPSPYADARGGGRPPREPRGEDAPCCSAASCMGLHHAPSVPSTGGCDTVARGTTPVGRRCAPRWGGGGGQHTLGFSALGRARDPPPSRGKHGGQRPLVVGAREGF